MMDQSLAATDVIDWHHPEITGLAREFACGAVLLRASGIPTAFCYQRMSGLRSDARAVIRRLCGHAAVLSAARNEGRSHRREGSRHADRRACPPLLNRLHMDERSAASV